MDIALKVPEISTKNMGITSSSFHWVKCMQKNKLVPRVSPLHGEEESFLLSQ